MNRSTALEDKFVVEDNPFGTQGGISGGALAAGDADADGDVDFIVSGLISVNGSNQTGLRYFNNRLTEVSPPPPLPGAPSLNDPVVDVARGEVRFSWTPPAAAGNDANGLFYNLKVWNPGWGTNDVPDSYGTPMLGNYILHSTGPVRINLELADNSNYLWAVSSISPQLSRGPWAFGSGFSVPDIPPANIDDLRAEPGAQVRLSWTASGDKGRRGVVKKYILYSAPFAFSTGNEAGVEQREISTDLKRGGQLELREIDNLPPHQLLYFALRAYDSQNQATDLSPVVSAPSNSFSRTEMGTGLNEGSMALGVIWGTADEGLDTLTMGYRGPTFPSRTLQLFNNRGGLNFQTASYDDFGLRNGDTLLVDLDRDGLLDVISSGAQEDGQEFTKVFINKQGSFAPITTNLPAMTNGQMAAGDFDNDGDIDVVAVGEGTGGILLYENVVEASTWSLRSKIIYPLELNSGAAIVAADLDRDGYLDLVASGVDLNGRTRLIFLRQDFPGHFMLWKEPYGSEDGYRSSSLAVGDFNRDGRWDIVAMGTRKDSKKTEAVIFEAPINNSDAYIVHVASIGVSNASKGTRSLAVADFDNDGYEDFAIAGQEKEDGTSLGRFFIYRNNGQMAAGPLTWDYEEPFGHNKGLKNASLAVGDITDNGDPDLWAMGLNENLERKVILLRNWNAIKGSRPPNTKPSAPTITDTIVNGSSLTLRWTYPNADADVSALTYDLAIQYDDQIANSHATLLSESIATPFVGNVPTIGMTAGGTLERTLFLRDQANYQIKIRAIDSGTRAGPYSAPVNVNIGLVAPGTVGDFSATKGAQVNLRWIAPRGNDGTGAAAKYEIQASLTPIDPANPSEFKNHIEVSAPTPGFPGSEESMTVTGLDAGKLYFFGIRSLNATNSVSSIAVAGGVVAGSLGLVSISSAPNVNAMALADDNGDGKQDLFTAGNTGLRIWSLANQQAELKTVAATVDLSSAALTVFDMDRDARPDALVSRQVGGTKTLIYRANGSSYDLVDSMLPAARRGALAWGDYDNDGDFDVMAVGEDLNGIYLFKNEASEQPTKPFTSVKLSSLKLMDGAAALWADLNQDGRLDIVVAGGDPISAPSTPRLRVFVQKADGTFNDAQTLPEATREVGFKDASLALADINADGKLDVIASGMTSSGAKIMVFLNQTASGSATISMLEQALPEPGLSLRNYQGQGLAVADVNNDGVADIVGVGTDSDNKPRAVAFEKTSTGWSGTDLFATSKAPGNASVVSADVDGVGGAEVVISGVFGNQPSIAYFKNVANDNAAPSAPTNVSVTNPDTDNLEITWTQATDRAPNPTPSSQLRYEILVEASSSFSNPVYSTLISTVVGTPVTGNISPVSVGDSALRATVRGKDSFTHRVWVRAIDAGLLRGDWSEPVIRQVGEVPPAFVSDLVATNGVQVRLQWTAVGADGTHGTATAYDLRYWPGDNPPTDFTQWIAYSLPAPKPSGTRETAVITGLVPGDKYHFKLKVIDDRGNSSISNDAMANAGAFEQVQELLNAGAGSTAMATDNDNTTMLAVQGSSDATAGQLLVYKYNGTTFSLMQDLGKPFLSGQVSFVDYDHDGILDVVAGGVEKTRFSSQNKLYFLRRIAGVWTDDTAALRFYRRSGATWVADTGVVSLSPTSMVWKDVNADGQPDLIVSGSPASGAKFTYVYENHYPDFYRMWENPTQGGWVAVADFDGDGMNDLVLSGRNGSNTKQTVFYKNVLNDSPTTYFLTPAAGSSANVGAFYGAVSAGDWNGDGRPDIAVAGRDELSPLKIFITTSPGSFEARNPSEFGNLQLSSASFAWGDVDNQGRLDLSVSGYDELGRARFIIYQNVDGQAPSAPQEPLDNAAPINSVLSGDIDGDGNLDMITMGNDSAGMGHLLFLRNRATPGNQPPASPTPLTPVVSGSKLTLSWSAPSDDTSPSSSLMYALEIATAPLPGALVVAKYYLPTTPFMGDTPRTSYDFSVRDGLTYYWRVKAIDASLKEGAWAIGQPLAISVIPPAQITDFTAQTGLQIRLKWTASGDDGSVGRAFAYHISYRKDGAGAWLPLEALMAIPVPAAAGTPEVLDVTGLEPGSFYSFKIQVEDSAQALSLETESGLARASNFVIASAPFGNADGLDKGDVAWGDFDGNGTMDFLVTGSSGTLATTRIYKNDGNGNFTAFTNEGDGYSVFDSFTAAQVSVADLKTISKGSLAFAILGREKVSGSNKLELYFRDSVALPGFTRLDLTNCRNDGSDYCGLADGALAFGDADGDGDADLALMGHSANGENRLFILKNQNGALTYDSKWDFSASSGAAYGHLAWIDTNNDGLADLAVLGRSDKSRIRIYLNSGNPNNLFPTSFEPGPVNFFSSARLAIGDYDNDGDMDVLAQMSNQFRIFDNQFMQIGLSSMTTVNPGLPGLGTSGAAWADFNNDGLLDILYAGLAGSQRRFIAAPQVVRGQRFDLADAQNLMGSTDGLDNASLSAADFDGDGDVDFVAMGRATDAGSRRFWVLRNVAVQNGRANTAPAAVDSNSIEFGYFDNRAHIRFNAPSDQNADGASATNSLTYAVRLWSGAADYDSAYASNRTAIVSAGDSVLSMPIKKNFALEVPAVDGAVYFVQVRARDAALQYGPWSAVKSFTFNRISAPQNTTGESVSASALLWSWAAPIQKTGLLGYRVVDAVSGDIKATLDANTLSWSEPALLSDTVYNRRIEAYNVVTSSAAASVSARTRVRDFTGKPDAPVITMNVTDPAEVALLDSLKLAWTDSTPAPTATDDRQAEGYHVYRSTSLDDVSFVQIQAIVPAATSTSDLSLNPNTTYYYKVSGFNRLGDGPLSAVASGVTRPQRPIGPRFEGVFSSSITVSWNSDHEAGSRFQVELSKTAEFDEIAQSTTMSKSGPARFVTARVDNLEPLTTYYARVLAISSIANFPQVAISTVPTFTVTLEPVVTLPKPVITGVEYFADKDAWNGLRVVWDAVTLAESYTLERSASPTSGFREIASGITAQEYSDIGTLTAGTSYFYRLQARASRFASPKSDVKGAMTKPAPVVAWDSSLVYSSSIVVRWIAPNNPATVRYELRQSTTNFSTVADPRLYFSTSAIAGLLIPLTANTSYQFMVRSKNLSNISPSSELSDVPVLNLVTNAALPIAQAFSDIGADFVTANWAPNNNSGETSYVAQLSLQDTFPLGSRIEATVIGNSVQLIGLASDTLYFGRVMAINRLGIATDWVSLGSVRTLNGNFKVAAPTEFAVTAVSSNTIDLAWSYSGQNQTGFRLDRSLNGDSWGTLVAALPAEARTYRDSGVGPNTKYFYRVLAFNAVAFSQPTPAVSKVTFAADPTRLANSFVMHETSATINWGRNGNPLDTGFQLRTAAEPFTTFNERPVVQATSTVIDSLTPNTTYQIDIRSINREDVVTNWQWSGFGRIATLALEPTAATISNIEISSATLTFDTRSNPPGTTYEIQTSIDPAFQTIELARFTTAAGSFAFTGLSGDTIYFARVRAINHGGQPSQFSVYTDSFHTKGGPAFDPNPPSAPTINSVTNNSIGLTWNPVNVTVAGEAPRAATYVLKRRQGLNEPIDIPANGTSYDDSNLLPNTAYDYQLLATDSQLFSRASIAASTVTMADAPGALTQMEFTSTTLKVAWDPQRNPSDTTYRIKITGVVPVQPAFSDVVAASTYTFNQLTPNARYTVHVQALSRNNTPSPAAYLLLTTTATLPAVVTPTLKVFVSSMTLSWGLINPADTTYHLLVTNTATQALVFDQNDVLGFNATATGLAANTAFSYQLFANGRDGAVVLAASGPFFTGASPVVSGTLSVSSNFIRVSNVTTLFTNPPTTRYRLSALKKSNGQVSQIDALLDNNAIQVAGLLPNTTYQVSLAALADDGRVSNFLALGSTPTWATPPLNFVVTETGVNSVAAAWELGDNALRTQFEMETVKAGESTGLLTSRTEALNARETRLQPNTDYVVRARAINHAGVPSEWSVSVTTHTADAGVLVGPPQNVTITPELSQGNQAMHVRWDAATGFVDAYIVYRVDSQVRELIRLGSTAREFVDTDPTLIPNTDYSYRVAASTKQILNYSAVVTTATFAAPVTVASVAPGVAENSIAHTWNDERNPAPVSYIAQLSVTASFAQIDSERRPTTKFATFNALSADTSYYARVLSVNHLGVVSPVEWATALPLAVTLASQPSAADPAITNVGSSSLDGHWTSTNPNGTRFLLETDWLGVPGGPGPSVWTTNPNSATVDGLFPNQLYRVKVSAANHAGVRTTPPVVLGTTRTTIGVLISSPTNLSLTRPADGSIKISLTWTDMSSDETGFNIYVWKDNDAPILAKSVAADVTTADIDAVLPNTHVNAYVVAIKGQQSSLPSNIASITTWAELPTWSNVPLSAAEKSITGFWSQANNPSTTRYTLELSTVSNFTPSFITQSIDATGGSATREGLFSNTLYWARLTALERPDAAELKYTISKSTLTRAAVPELIQIGDTFTAAVTSVTARWASNQNAMDTGYRLDVYSDEDYSQFVKSADFVDTVGQIDGLTPNGTYWFAVKAKNRDDGQFTAARNLGATVTLPNAFAVDSSSPASTSIWYGANTTDKTAQFKFTLASGRASYFRYVWLSNNQSNFEWPSDGNQTMIATVWNAETPLVVDAPSTGIYWLHLRGYNAQGHSSDASILKLGPFQVDVRAPRPNPASFGNLEIHATSITFLSTQISDEEGGLGAGLPPLAYGWSFDGGDEQFNLLASSQTVGLEPNSVHTMRLRTQDAAVPANISESTETTSVTLQNTPTAIIVKQVAQTSIAADVVGSFPGLDIGDSGFQLSATDDKGVEKISERGRVNPVQILELTKNTSYVLRARSFNRVGEPSPWFESVSTATLSTAPLIDYDLDPAAPNVYPGNTIVHFQDRGAFARGEVGSYRYAVNNQASFPNLDVAGTLVGAGNWPITFTQNGAMYVHVRSYNRSGQSQPGDYVALGPWVIDGSAPRFLEPPSVVVHGASSMTFTAGLVEDVGLTGFPPERFSFDGGETWTDSDSKLLENLDPNTSATVRVVVRDRAGNRTAPAPLSATTFQNTPTRVGIFSRQDRSVLVEATGTLPRNNVGQSGVFFELVSPETSRAASGWVQDSTATFALDAYDSAYTFHAKARNADGVETGWTADSTPLWTLAKPPRVEAADGAPQPQTWVKTRSFKFRVLDLPRGPANEPQYRRLIYAFTNDAAYQFTGNEDSWIPTVIGEEKTVVIPAGVTNPTGTWYFKVRSVNGNGDLTAPTVPEPWYGVDVNAPLPNPPQFGTPVVGTSFITWSALETSTDADSGLDPLRAYQWASNGSDVFFDGSLSSTTASLSANAEYSIRLKLKDRVGNETAVATLSTATWAFAPIVFPGSLVVTSDTITAKWLANGNPAGTAFQIQLDQSLAFSSPQAQLLTFPGGPNAMEKTFTSLNGQPLTPNTTYFLQVRAENIHGVPTAWVALGTATTKAVTPLVIVSTNAANKSDIAKTNASYSSNSEFFATTTQSFGPGSADYFRWVWTKSSDYSFFGNEDKWDSTSINISTRISEEGPWYLHVAAYAGGKIDETPPTIHMGPYLIFVGAGDNPHLLAAVQSSTEVQWILLRANGDNFTETGLHYGFQDPAQPTVVWRALDTQNGQFLTQASSSTAGLNPNTAYNMLGYLRDSTNVIAGPVTAAATTYQTTPTGVAAQFSETRLNLNVLGDFRNLGIGLTGFEVRAIDAVSGLSRTIISSSTTQIFEPIMPNHRYSLSARARNMDGIWTPTSAATSIVTFAQSPTSLTVAPDTSDQDEPLFQAGLCYSVGKRFAFVNHAGWENIRSYKVLVNSVATAAPEEFNGADATPWTALKFSTVPATDGRYYVHFRTYNDDGVGGPTVYNYGPLIVDATPPLVPTLESVAVNISSLAWIASVAVDNPNGCGADRADAYNFRVGMDDSRWQARQHEALVLAPNTRYDINLAVRDNVGNTSAPVGFSTYTLAATPIGRPDELQVNLTEGLVFWYKNFNSTITVYDVGASESQNMDAAIISEAGVDVESGTVHGLRADTLYYFAVRARNANGISTPWALAGSTRTSDILLAPEITAIASSSTSITMGWKDFGPSAVQFDTIFNTGETLVLPGTPRPPDADHLRRFESLTPNTTYTVGVRSRMLSQQTTFMSAYVSSTSVTSAEKPTAKAFAVYTDSAALSWTEGLLSTPLTTRYEAKAALTSDLNGTGVSMLITSTDVVLSGLVPDTSYYFAVRAINHAGRVTAWEPLGIGITHISAPLAPYIFSNVRPTALTLAWSSGGNRAPPTVYRIDWSLDNSFDSIGASANISDTNVTFENLSYDTTYFFRGRAIGVHDTSPQVLMGSMVTLATSPITGMLVPEISAVTATWDRNNNPARTRFRVELSSQSSFLEIHADTVTTANTARLTPLISNTTYWARITAINGAGVPTLPAVNFAAPVVTLANTPATPAGRGKWDASGSLGNYIEINLSPGDNNPSDSLYAIYNVDSNAYLMGDVNASTSAAVVWLTRDEWRTRARHGRLNARTEYHYKAKVMSRSGLITNDSPVGTIITVPAKPNLAGSVLDDDMALLNWNLNPAGAEEYKIYVSPTGEATSYHPYFDTILPTQPGVHYLEPTGDDATFPGDIAQARHDSEGAVPARVPSLDFSTATASDVTFAWAPVPNPAANQRHFYYMTGVSSLGEEGEPSSPISIQVQPLIRAYEFIGTKNGEAYSARVATDPAKTTLAGLEPNTKLVVQVRAVSSDNKLAGELSPSVTAWALANVPGQPAISAGFDESHKVFLTIVFSTSGNRANTQYAIQLVQRGNDDLRAQSVWLESKGGFQNTKFWMTASEWMDSPYTNVDLLANTVYTYQVFARNGDKISAGPWIETAGSVEGSGTTVPISSPTKLRGVGLSKDSILWTWKDNATDETGFHVLALDGSTKATRPHSEPLQTDQPDGVSVQEFNIPTPNTMVTRTVVAYSPNGASLPSAAATSYTLAADAQIESINHQQDVISTEIKFKFENKLPFGPGTAAYYRVKFTTVTAYQFVGNEAIWNEQDQTREFERDITASYTTWYLYVTSYNGQDTPSLPVRFGPYPLFQDIIKPAVEELVQDGASSQHGARPVGERPTWEAPVDGVHDISFQASIPWAPLSHAIHLTLTKRLEPTTINRSNVIVRAIEDNNSTVLTNPPTLNYTLTYNDDERQLVINFDQPGLPAGYLFELTLSPDVRDLAGNSFTSDFRYKFRTFQEKSAEHTYYVMDPSGMPPTQLHFDAGALPEAGTVGVENDPELFPWGFAPSAEALATQKQMGLGGAFAKPLSRRYVSINDTRHARLSGVLTGAASIAIPYLDKNNDGIIDDENSTTPTGENQRSGSVAGAQIKTSTLGLYRLDEEHQLWIKVPGVVVDSQSKMVRGTVYRLGLFAVMGAPSTDVGSAYAYPVPFVASRDTTVKFANLPDEGEILIYTAATGELVKTIKIEPGHADPFPWNVTNDSGQPLGADVYTYQIKAGGNRKTGKLVIVR